MKGLAFNPGFRLSITDVFILIIGAIGAVYLMSIDINLSLIILFVIGHFFLFCNITRMARTLELIWAVSFLALCIGSIKFNLLPLNIVFLTSAMLTIGLTVYEVRKPSYHGAFWQTFNPSLKEWFEKK